MSPGIYLGEELSRYGFGRGHPFGTDRLAAFETRLRIVLPGDRVRILPPVRGTRAQCALFHEAAYLDTLHAASEHGGGYLDHGDTPAFVGIEDAALWVVGSVLDAVDRLMAGELRQAFVPIAGLHHARRDGAAGFCAVNDCGIAIEHLKHRHGLRRIAYVDIDAHHGDGVFYAFADDPVVRFADIHEDGRFLYPGSGAITETGRGDAKGLKLNVPMPMYADDDAFDKVWPTVEAFIADSDPEFILFQCGADSLAGDPIAHLRYSEASHAHAARALKRIAEEHCDGRVLGLGGGGYERPNLAKAWTAVVQAWS